MTVESVQTNKIYPHADSRYECVEPPGTDSDPKEMTMGSSTSTLVSTSSANVEPLVMTSVSEAPGHVGLGGSPAPVQSTQRAGEEASQADPTTPWNASRRTIPT